MKALKLALVVITMINVLLCLVLGTALSTVFLWVLIIDKKLFTNIYILLISWLFAPGLQLVSILSDVLVICSTSKNKIKDLNEDLLLSSITVSHLSRHVVNAIFKDYLKKVDIPNNSIVNNYE